MILVINVSKERLHYFEFVKPVEDILKKNSKDFFTLSYSELSHNALKRASKVIICGTSLKDNYYLNDIDRFSWIKDFKKPILGICAGFQIMGLLYGGKLAYKKEIGYFSENFEREFFGLLGKVEVYHLHKNYVKELNKDWIVYCKNKGVIQAVKHKERDFFGVLFHPEVRNKELVLGFVNF